MNLDDPSVLAGVMRALPPAAACELAVGLLNSYSTARAPRAVLRTVAALLRHTADVVERMIEHAPPDAPEIR